jgi:hypothetical protein
MLCPAAAQHTVAPVHVCVSVCYMRPVEAGQHAALRQLGHLRPTGRQLESSICRQGLNVRVEHSCSPPQAQVLVKSADVATEHATRGAAPGVRQQWAVTVLDAKVYMMSAVASLDALAVTAGKTTRSALRWTV